MATNHEQIYKQLGRRVEHLRVEKGMTQEEVAAKAEISHSYYSRIRDGRNISLRLAVNLADALDVKLSELFDFQ